MSDRVYSDFLDDIRKSSALIVSFTEGMDYALFASDFKTQYAVIRCFEVMGEASKRIPDEIRDAHPSIPWKTLAGMRDRLIHGYDIVDVSVLWRTVKNDIPPLLESLKDVRF